MWITWCYSYSFMRFYIVCRRSSFKGGKKQCIYSLLVFYLQVRQLVKGKHRKWALNLFYDVIFTWPPPNPWIYREVTSNLEFLYSTVEFWSFVLPILMTIPMNLSSVTGILNHFQLCILCIREEILETSHWFDTI